jgi:hypothetical protein
MLLPSNRTEQPWWQNQVERWRDGKGMLGGLSVHFLPGRTVYGCPGNPEGVGMGSPPFGSVALHWNSKA